MDDETVWRWRWRCPECGWVEQGEGDRHRATQRILDHQADEQIRRRLAS